MSDIQSRIASMAPRHDELLAILAETDYAAPALQQQMRYIKDLEKELNSIASTIKKLESATKLEKKQFDEYRESNVKRWAHKMGGSKGKAKFQTKTEKEEREYYEALEAERSAKDRQESISKALEEAKGTHDKYKKDVDVHNNSQSELDKLYNMVFAGPTPDYPAEDQSEWTFTQARTKFDVTEQHFRAVNQAVHIFKEAKQHISQASQYMAEARDASRMDMFGGGTFADMAERNALSNAQSHASQVQSLISQAQRMYPTGVQSIGPINIAQGNMMGDVLFDNIFSDMDFHEKIKSSQLQVENAQKNLIAQLQKLAQKEKTVKAELDKDQTALTEARKALQQTRGAIVAQAAGSKPPAYSA